MKPKRRVLPIGFFALVASGWLASAEPNSKEQRPNVILVMTDDQGYGDLRFHGNDKIDTPVLDRLAKESTRFGRFMVCPLCSMTRASLLSGRYNLRTGCASVTRGLETVRPDEVLIPEVLKAAGYATGCFGKWHIGEHYPSHPNGQGFDEFFGMPQGHWDDYFDPVLEHNGKMVATKGYITDVLTDAAMKFIEQHRDGPFFCYIPYNAPHTPMQVADRYYDKYTDRGIKDKKTAAIYGMVQNIDENVGRLLALLDDLGLAENTIVIFLSDNGAEGSEMSRYNAGMRGWKGSVHEGGVRVPMFVRWPGKIEADRVLPQLAAHIDMLPTISELCGVTKLNTKPLDGRSLAPLLLGRDADWPRDRMIFARNPGWRHLVGITGRNLESGTRPYPGSVRTERWRAVNDGQGWELFDVRADPGETTDVAATHPDVMTRLAKAYEDWFADVTTVPITRPTIDIGHAEWPVTKLTVPEAYFTGRIHWYNQYGFAHDWLTGWSDPQDRIWWETNVVTAGRYQVTLRYACAKDAVGTKLRISAAGSSLDGVIREAHEPRPVQRPTRINKKRFVQTFALQELGEIKLNQGHTRITIEAVHKPGNQVCDVHSLILTLTAKDDQ